MTSTLLHALQRGMRGKVSDGAADLDALTSDFGAIIRRLPLLTVRPTCTDDVVHILRTARAARIPVTVRSRGNSVSGQTLSDGAISLDMRDFARIGAVSVDRRCITVEPGAVWHAVIARALGSDRAPRVRPSNLYTTVGGTHSVGGISPDTHRFGCVADQCRGLEAVLADGRVVRLSPTVEPELYAHTLCGLGQIGIITEVDVGLDPFLRYQHAWRLIYGSLALLLSDMQHLVLGGMAASISAETVRLRGQGRFAYALEVVLQSDAVSVAYESTPLADCSPLKVLPRPRSEVRHRALDSVTPRPGPPGDPRPWGHPWIDLILAPERVPTFFARARHDLPAALLAAAHVIFWPLRRDTLRQPLFVMPPVPYAVLNSIMPTVSPEQTLTAARQMQQLGRWGERLGGKRYLYGWIDTAQAEWAAHFGDAWPGLVATKRRYDADGILNPGFIHFADRTGVGATGVQ